MPPWSYLSSRIATTVFEPGSTESLHFPTWTSVLRWCRDIQDGSISADSSVYALARELTRGLNSPEERAERISRFVRDEIRYVGLELGKGRWAPRPAGSTLHDRYGDCKDKAILMRTMLQALDIPSYSVMANTNKTVHPDLPTPFQFNHCIVAIPLAALSRADSSPGPIVNGCLLFDPTFEETSLWSLPLHLQGKNVLVLNPADTSLHRTPRPSSERNRRRFTGNATLHPDGSLIAQLTITDYGAYADYTRYTLKKTDRAARVREWQELLGQSLEAPAISDYKSASDADSTWQVFTVKSKRAGTASGSNLLLKLDFFHPSESPELSKETRYHPVWFGGSEQVETAINWNLPRTWTVEEDAPGMNQSCAGAQLSFSVLQRDSSVRFASLYRQTGELMPVGDYQRARKFSEDLSNMNNLVVFIKPR